MTKPPEYYPLPNRRQSSTSPLTNYHVIDYIFHLLSIEKFETLTRNTRNDFYKQDREIVILIIQGREKVF